jgi:membrane-associated protease RseP (regulator of RpoE activity)
MTRTASLAGLLLLSLVLPLRAEDPSAKPVTVPFELFPTKHIAVKIKVNGKGPYRVIFDTGSPVALLSNKVADDTGLLDRKGPQPLFNPFGAGGEAKVKEMELGDLKLKKVPVIIMDHPGVQAMAQAFGPVEGIVGFPVFARSRMTLDYKAKTITFAPSKYEPTDALQGIVASLMTVGSDTPPKSVGAAGQWGLVVRKGKDDKDAGVTVKEVMPGSAAAAAGLMAGDRLLTLDGRWTDSLADTYLAASQVKPGESVVVVVKRDGKELELTVKPAPGL